MSAREQLDPREPWVKFVIGHCYGANAADLAFILGQPAAAINRLRATGVCSKTTRRKNYVELFSLWHGREPTDQDWPPPRKGGGGGYLWQGPEYALLANLVGRLGTKEIVRILTERLRQLTGDQSAERNSTAVWIAMQRVGLEAKDVMGGITTSQAAREAGSLTVVHEALRRGDLPTLRAGKLHVIPRDAWDQWKSRRILPPEKYVRLATLKGPLGIRSDKLSEFAKMGYVPTAVRCKPCGGVPSTQFGTWYIDQDAAEKLVADRRAGRPMPWHGKVLPKNLSTSYKLWIARRHPRQCGTCANIWGTTGAPQSFESYAERYPGLAHGAKRHLTLPWQPGLTAAEISRKTDLPQRCVRKAIRNGLITATRYGRKMYVTRSDVARWIDRGCPLGENRGSWISLATASERYLFTTDELEKFVATDQLASKLGTAGTMRGVTYVSKRQCAQLRETIGFTEEEAARRTGLSVQELRISLEGLTWRDTDGIRLSAVQAVIKRLEKATGYTVEDAARTLDQDVSWIRAKVDDGTVILRETKHRDGRPRLSDEMLARLRRALTNPQPPTRPGADLLRLSEAAREAGVSTGTIIKWATCGELERTHAQGGWRYGREDVRSRARLYWKTVRFHRVDPPSWLRSQDMLEESTPA